MEGERHSVLVAEDEDSLRLAVSAWLRDEGFDVEDVPDGDAAIGKFQERDFDIALLDIKMPGRNGLEVLRYIRKNSIDTDVVLMTGMSDISMAVEAMKMGAKEYLTKPLAMDQLVDQLRSLIKKKTSEERIRTLQAEHTARLLYDLHNPIAGLKQSIGYLLKGMAGPIGDHQKELLTFMTRNIEKVIHLLNDMMDLSKLEGGRVRLNKGISNPNDTIKKVLQEFQVPFKSNKLKVSFTPNGEIPPIEYDQEKIEQVLENILTNALSHTPEEGSITLEVQQSTLVVDEAEAPSDNVIVSVKNSGKGIPKEVLPLIFDRFRNIKTEGGEEQSIGLGLIICQKIIEAHNGKIWVESDQGQSAAFFFALPIR